MGTLYKALALLAIVSIAICPLAMAEDTDAAGSLSGLMLYQINPETSEGVAVHNYGSSSVDLKDYTIADMPTLTGGEGTITFSQSITVAAGATVVIVSERTDGNAFSSQSYTTYAFGENGVTKNKQFNLANGGDDVYLYKGETIIDAVFYGSKSGDGVYWTGDGVDISGDSFAVRTGSTDTDTAKDWTQFGRTGLEFDADLQYSATVTPFLFPESGGIPVYQALESATESIRVNLYLLTSSNMLSLLCYKAAEGVSVQILLEGAPLGYTSSIATIAPYLATIESQGGEVRFIGGTDSNRYSYDHAKYAIIDGDTVVVTSENWTAANVNGSIDTNAYDSGTLGNRGWGVVVESAEYATYMNYVFETDWSTEYGDVTLFSEEYPNANTRTYSYESPSYTGTFASYTATVTPILSSDNSYEALEYYVSNATERAYSEQQSLSDSYMDMGDDSPITLFSNAANRGVDSRLIFGSTNVDSSTVLEINMKTGIKAASMSTPTLHNKGVICDDS
ncbi:MAG: phospholipase D-like domain-containing protein, partial [Thermoplasmata archaeon]|nr:phospholipase D-like domain-containing protein [Thermoplasmata archaeon]